MPSLFNIGKVKCVPLKYTEHRRTKKIHLAKLETACTTRHLVHHEECSIEPSITFSCSMLALSSLSVESSMLSVSVLASS